jgi:uncharacterized lipoprotein YmbA
MRHPPSWLGLAAATGALLFVTGCVGQSPRVEYYTLASVAAGAEVGLLPAPAVAVGPADFPRELDRSPIATRLSPNRIEYDDFHRWAGTLDADFLGVAAVNLARLLGTDRVVVYPAPPSFPLDYRVLFDVIRFDADSGGTVVLEARWILQSAGGDALDVGSVRSVQSAPADDYEARAAAHSAAVGELCRIVAERIRALATAG